MRRHGAGHGAGLWRGAGAAAPAPPAVLLAAEHRGERVASAAPCCCFCCDGAAAGGVQEQEQQQQAGLSTLDLPSAGCPARADGRGAPQGTDVARWESVRVAPRCHAQARARSDPWRPLARSRAREAGVTACSPRGRGKEWRHDHLMIERGLPDRPRACRTTQSAPPPSAMRGAATRQHLPSKSRGSSGRGSPAVPVARRPNGVERRREVEKNCARSGASAHAEALGQHRPLSPRSLTPASLHFLAKPS